MKKRLGRLALNRETLRRLDEPSLRRLAGNGVAEIGPFSPGDPNCMSPLCVPTFWASCECRAE